MKEDERRKLYLQLAAAGLSMPFGADLVLRTRDNSEQILLDGLELGRILVETAKRFDTSLAFPLMDLTLEKDWMLSILGIVEEERATFHFEKCPDAADLRKLKTGLLESPVPRIVASCHAISHVASTTELLPVGMALGPFSLMTKLMSDPITAVYLAGAGAAADEEVRIMEAALKMGLKVILQNIELQCRAGARAICICEPAASVTYISPNQMEGEGDIFDRLVIEPNLIVRERLRNLKCDLVFHDCGELSDEMVRRFNRLEPVILSLGSSRILWEDAALVSKDIVLFGNLPSKRFYSDKDCPDSLVGNMSRELVERMAEAGHPFILGTECDVLSVPDAHSRIMDKVDTMQASGKVRE